MKKFEYTTDQMKKVIELEIKMTLECNKSQEYCDTYWAFPEDRRPLVGLTISYDMGLE